MDPINTFFRHLEFRGEDHLSTSRYYAVTH